jgi:hypothetical protein
MMILGSANSASRSVVQRTPSSIAANWASFASLRPTHLEQLENREPAAVGLLGTLLESLPKGDRLPGPSALHQISSIARQRWRETPELLPERRLYRPRTLSKFAGLLDE